MRRSNTYTGRAVVLFWAVAALIVSMLFIKSDVYAASVPAKVTAKLASSSSDTIKIKWNNVSGETGYFVYRRVPSGKYQKIGTVAANVTSYTDKTVESATIYDYAVRAYKKSNAYRGAYKRVRVATNPENVTTDVKVQSNGNVKLSWDKAARVDGYRVWRRKSGDAWTAINDVSHTVTSCSDSDAVPGATYVYCVWGYKAVDGGRVHGECVPSDEVKVPVQETEKSGTMTAAQKEVMKKIIYAVESGGQVYGNQDYSSYIGPGTNTSNEVAITVGAGQWYATEAGRLLRSIYAAAPQLFADAPKLVKDLTSADWAHYNPSAARKKAIISIISSDVGIKCQDKLMIAQIEELASTARNKYGVTTVSGQAEAINILHQGGESALARILAKTKKPYNADTIYAALCTDPADKSNNNQVGDYESRQIKVYEYIKKYL